MTSESSGALELVDYSAWCPPGCQCVVPQSGHYRFPPNTCVEIEGQCPDCPLVGTACLECPSTLMDAQCDDSSACNATVLDVEFQATRDT